MTWNISGGVLAKDKVKLTSSSVTDGLDLGKRVQLLSIIASETNGGTPAFTIEIYDKDASTSHYLRKAKAMGANATEVFDYPIALDPNEKLRFTSGDASGHIHVTVTYLNPVNLGVR